MIRSLFTVSEVQNHYTIPVRSYRLLICISWACRTVWHVSIYKFSYVTAAVIISAILHFITIRLVTIPNKWRNVRKNVSFCNNMIILDKLALREGLHFNVLFWKHNDVINWSNVAQSIILSVVLKLDYDDVQ